MRSRSQLRSRHAIKVTRTHRFSGASDERSVMNRFRRQSHFDSASLGFLDCHMVAHPIWEVGKFNFVPSSILVVLKVS